MQEDFTSTALPDSCFRNWDLVPQLLPRTTAPLSQRDPGGREERESPINTCTRESGPCCKAESWILCLVCWTHCADQDLPFPGEVLYLYLLLSLVSGGDGKWLLIQHLIFQSRKLPCGLVFCQLSVTTNFCGHLYLAKKTGKVSSKTALKIYWKPICSVDNFIRWRYSKRLTTSALRCKGAFAVPPCHRYSCLQDWCCDLLNTLFPILAFFCGWTSCCVWSGPDLTASSECQPPQWTRQDIGYSPTQTCLFKAFLQDSD